MKLGDVAPGLTQLRPYDRKWLRGDVLAGLTVAAYLIPQVMAYGTLAGLSPVVGLWAAVGPLLVYAVFGSSRQLSVGPESTTALMTAAVLMPMAVGDAGRYAALAAALAILVGGVCFLAGVARLGFLANLLSRPVLVGYMTGIAVVMIVSQLEKLSGIPVTGEEFVSQVRSFGAGVAHVQWATVALSVAVLVVLLAMDRWLPRAPGPLIAVLLATAVVALFSLHAKGIAVVGPVPPGLPQPGLPSVSIRDFAALLVPACGIAIVAFSDNILTARTFSVRRGEELDANAELRALGLCNAAAGVTHGLPVSSSASRTTLGDAVGSRTQLFSLVMLAAVLAVVLWAHNVLALFPKAALGALIVYAALRLIDVRAYRRLARFRRSELILAVATTAAVLAFGVLYGVLVAVGLSILDLLRRVAHAHDSVLGFVPGIAGMHDVDDYPDAQPVPGLLLYRYDAPLCFANAEDFRKRALNALDANPDPVAWFVLNAEATMEADLTALDALDQLHDELSKRGIVFALARVKQHLRDSLKASGLIDKIGEDRIFMTLPTAVDAFNQRRTA